MSSASECGFFTLLVEGQPLASVSAGSLLGLTSVHGRLQASFTAGESRSYSMGVRITRPYTAILQVTQHLDNATIIETAGECYANCDQSTGTPRLTPNDFQCFVSRFASNDAYANCDGSTAASALTPNDFICFVNRYAKGNAYANCDGSTGVPLLTGNDFVCFVNRYAQQDPYANCDASPQQPLLSANDFLCFINAYAAGCP